MQMIGMKAKLKTGFVLKQIHILHDKAVNARG